MGCSAVLLRLFPDNDQKTVANSLLIQEYQFATVFCCKCDGEGGRNKHKIIFQHLCLRFTHSYHTPNKRREHMSKCSYQLFLASR